jgi:LacI family transcriptional regulator
MSNAYKIRVDPKSAIPLATQLSQQFSWLIISGALDEGEELPAIQQLADELGINVHTVRAGYQQLAANRLVTLGRGRKARVLGFDRSRPQDSGGKVPSYSIGVIIPEFVSFYAPLLAGIEAEAATQPAMVFVANAREDQTTAMRYLDRLVAKGVDGIIVAAALVPPEATLPPPGQPPIVYVDAPGAPGPSIEFDLIGSQHLATGHLIEHGHQRIGYITPPVALPNVAPKLTGHNKALEVGGIEPDPQLVVETQDFEVSSGRQAAEKLLRLEEPPTAIAAASDALAFGTYQTARDHGVRIPDDLAVIGNDNTDVSALMDPALSTVSLPAEKAGRLAVQTIDEIRSGHQPPQAMLDVELVVRASCGCETSPP